MRIATMILAAVVLAGGVAPAVAKTSASSAAQSPKSSSVRAGDSVPESKPQGRHHKGPPVLNVCSNQGSNGVGPSNCKAPVSPQ